MLPGWERIQPCTASVVQSSELAGWAERAGQAERRDRYKLPVVLAGAMGAGMQMALQAMK